VPLSKTGPQGRTAEQPRSLFMADTGSTSIDDSSNRIIRALSAKSRRRLSPALHRTNMTRGQVLGRTGGGVSHFYFVERGLISLVRPMQNGEGVEISAVGPEGIAPPGAVFDLERGVFELVVQISGSALRIRREELRRVLEQDRDFVQFMRGYASAALSRMAQTAACNILHTVAQRCCRWLLTAHDSARSDTFALTHEFLGVTLGVRRASVSAAAQSLQRAGLIRYSHGNMTIVNRRGLERAACECYATTEQEFAMLFRKRYGSR
jgi:CRP-like cAMP-binding protein